MPTNAPTEREIVDRVRAALIRRETPVSTQLWSRVEAGLSVAEAQPPVAVPRARMTVAHSAARRMRRLVAVAATLLVVCALGLYLATQPRTADQLVSGAQLQRTLDRQALEGPLELDGATRPLGRELYEGVAVKLGTEGTDALRACNPC